MQIYAEYTNYAIICLKTRNLAAMLKIIATQKQSYFWCTQYWKEFSESS